MSSMMLYSADLSITANILKDHSTFIIRVKQSIAVQHCLTTCLVTTAFTN